MGVDAGTESGHRGIVSIGPSGFRRTDNRSATARGYGRDWQRLRESILAAEPLCRFCASQGLVVPATDVDHITPFAGLDDPLRLDASNCRPLCRPCHMARTARQAKGLPEVAPVGLDGWPVG